MKMHGLALAGGLLVCSLLVPSASYATEKYLPSVEVNAPPKVSLASYDRVEFAPVTMKAPFEGQKPNVAARERIQEAFSNRTAPFMAALNARQAKADPASTLLIEPSIEKIKFIGTGARIWAGAFAGSSQILMRMKISDKATGEIIAEPEFYQRANGWGGAYSMGRTDNDMLGRITDQMTTYLSENLESTVGGRTGAEGLKD